MPTDIPSNDSPSEISSLTSAPSGLLTPTEGSNPAEASAVVVSEVRTPAIVRPMRKIRKSYVWNSDNGEEVTEHGIIRWKCNRCNLHGQLVHL
jgi:hypothetical protein